ncbi:MAG: ParM/StbA family protein [Ruminococcaceae bacterium]|nr:ParM/StbA family protein [Oscillospiraceae bacterium]
MQTSNDSLILGIDHGYGNIKTANKTFGTGVYVSDTEPAFKNNLLTWNGKYYTIGEGHKEFVADKIQDMDYYVLTLAAVAYELRARGLREAKVHLAAGLPLTWLSAQKEGFKQYLLQNKEVEFSFNTIDYRVEFTGADIFPQGFAAVADRINEFRGTNMLCDIGNGTMNVMLINEKKPENRRCFTEKFGTQQCVIQAKEDMMRTHHATVDESVITRVSGTLFSHLAEIDTQAEEMFSRLVEQMANAEGITEQLKEQNQLEWVQQMNNIRHRATEIVNAELIYV